jgi:FkbM family methyltransferase
LNTERDVEFLCKGKTVVIHGISHADWIYKTIKDTGTFYEIDLLKYINYAVGRKSGCILDVGANIGNHSVYFGTFIADRVICFEPNPAVRPCLEKNLSENSVKYKLYTLGLGEKSCSATIDLPPAHKNNIGASRLICGGGDGSRVQVVPLDSLIAEIKAYIGVLSILAIKIDVEGMEAAVLRGGRDTIREYKPDLFIEIIGHEQMEHIESVIGPLGYKRISCWAATPVWHYAHSDSLYLFRALKLRAYIVADKLSKRCMRFVKDTFAPRMIW